MKGFKIFINIVEKGVYDLKSNLNCKLKGRRLTSKLNSNFVKFFRSPKKKSLAQEVRQKRDISDRRSKV